MADNFTFKDSNAISRTLRATDVAGVFTAHNVIATLDGSTPVPVSATTPMPVTLPPEATDSFSRFRTSPPAFRFDSQLTYQIDADLWDSKTTGAGSTIAHDATNRAATLSASATASSSAILQSHYHSPYTPGRSQLAFVTFTLGATPGTGAYRKAGYFDGTNGVCIEQTSTVLNLVCMSGTALGTSTIPQASWNIDPFDGTGPSGMTLDVTKTQILVVSLQALYVGRAYVGFDIGGKVYLAHAFDHANLSAHPYIQTANLPVRYECGTTSAAVSMTAICASVISEGGEKLEDIPARNFPAWGEYTNTATKVLVAIRCKAQLNSINQHALVVPTGVEVVVADSGAWVSVLLNPTFSAGTWEDVDATSSVVEKTFAGNAGTDPTISANGSVIDRFYLPASATSRVTKSAGLAGKIVLSYSHLLGVGDSIAILVEGGATTDAWGTITWKEIR